MTYCNWNSCWEDINITTSSRIHATDYLSSMQFASGMLFTPVIWRNVVKYICLITDRDSWLLASSRSKRWNTIQQTWRTAAYEKISKFVSLNCFRFFFDDSLDSRYIIFVRHQERMILESESPIHDPLPILPLPFLVLCHTAWLF